MKKTIHLFSLLSLLILLLGCDNSTSLSASSTEYLDSQGKLRDLKSTQGRWLIINYWAQWCKPCLTEIPELNHFAQKNTTSVVVAVNYDGLSGEALIKQAKLANIQFPLVHQDPSQAMGFQYPDVLPTTYIFNPEGQLHKTLIGPQTFDSLTDNLK